MNTKIRIDYYQYANNKLYIYEGKTKNVNTKDLYQLIMYYDVLVDADISVDKAIIVADTIPEDVKKLIKMKNKCKDPNDNNYNLEYQYWMNMDRPVSKLRKQQIEGIN
ncbi:hypothetical protein M2S00_05080 [Apilactobacillus sp. TMW 2.2459]|uniref:hypothetical protein n=1 Tax=Apilactobacillus xinyiensis TaxID=2841032 RepID=UPI001C7CB2E8|nr:hypothetical protein [Apilactobacillus xinyiensis]MCL0312477.1 hypothetical protein [Apilactobacillus xinyiensis]